MENLCSGEIHFRRMGQGRLRKLVNYKLKTPPKAEFSELLLPKFDHLNLEPQERQGLTNHARRIIHAYKNLDYKEIRNSAKTLIKKIEDFPNHDIEIHASDVGGFICLMAIYHFSLPKNRKIHLYLHGVPLYLFPKKYIKGKSQLERVNITVSIDGDSWLTPLEGSLVRDTPHHDYINVQVSNLESVNLLSKVAA